MHAETALNDRPISAPVRAAAYAMEYRQRVMEAEYIRQASAAAKQMLGWLAGYNRTMTGRLWINTTHARRQVARRRLAQVADSVAALGLAIEDANLENQVAEINRADGVALRVLSAAAGLAMDRMDEATWRGLSADRRADAVDRMMALSGALTTLMYAFQAARERAGGSVEDKLARVTDTVAEVLR